MLLTLGPLSGWLFWEWIGLELAWKDRKERFAWLMSGNVGLGLFILLSAIGG